MKNLLRLVVLLALPLGAFAQTVVQNITYTSGQNVTTGGASTLTAGPNVLVSGGAAVTYVAPTRVTLSPGFTAAVGSYFHAYIGTPPNAGYALTVTNGTGGTSGLSSGSVVAIAAGSAPSGYVFNNWALDAGAGSFASAGSASTNFTMGNGSSTVRAVYVPAGLADTDGDGMADAWEQTYWGSLANGATGDADGDGVSNLDEYKAWRNPVGADAAGAKIALNAWISVLAKTSGTGTQSVTLNYQNGQTSTFTFTAGGGSWAKSSGTTQNLNLLTQFGNEESFTVSSTGVTDFFVKVDIPPEVQRQLQPIVEIDGKYSSGIAKAEIVSNAFKLRMRPGGQLPFGALDDSNLNVSRFVEFGLGGSSSGRSAGRIVLSLGSWAGDVSGAWTLNVIKGEAIQGSYETPLHFQAKVPAGYVDMMRDRNVIFVRYYDDTTAFTPNTFRNFGSAIPVATYQIDSVPSGPVSTAPTPAKTGVSWGSAVSKARFVITRTVGGVTHLREHETHWFSVRESTAPFPYNSGTAVIVSNYLTTVTRSWPWRTPATARSGFVRGERYTKSQRFETESGGALTDNTYDPADLDLTSYLGATEASAIGDYDHRNSDGLDSAMVRAVPITRGVGGDAHEVARRRAQQDGRGLAQGPTRYDNGLGGGSLTEYLSLRAGISGSDNLGTAPHIAVGEIKFVRQRFLDVAADVGFTTDSSDLVSTYTYNTELIDGLPMPSQILTQQGTTDIGKSVYSYATGTFNSLPTLTTSVANSTSSTASLTTTTLAYSRRIADVDLRGKVLAVTRPDGTKTSYAYQRGNLSGSSWSANGSGAQFLVAELTGKTGSGVTSYNGIAISGLDLDANRSVVTEKIFDGGGRLLREASYVYTGSFGLISATYSGYDVFGQLLAKADQPIGTGGRVFYEAGYLGFQKQWERDAQGITAVYQYDGYDQIYSRTRQGATSGAFAIAATTTTYAYDEINRLKTESLTGSGESDVLVTSYTYDTASRPKTQTTPGGLMTSIVYDTPVKKITTVPSGGVRVEFVYKDGRPQLVTDSAGPDSSTTYSYDSTGFLVTAQTTAGQTGTQYTDWLGRVDRTESATWNGNTRVSKNNYNSIGQLASQDVTVGGTKVALTHLYQYDAFGRLYREGLSSGTGPNPDPVNDFGVKEYEDRIVPGPLGYSSNLYLYSAQKIWPYAGGNASVARYTSQTYTQVTGLGSTTVAHTVNLDFDRNKTDSTQTVTRANALLETATTVTGTSVTLAQKNLNGLVVSSTNAQGQTVLQTYDGLGRLEASNDPRIGTSSVSYVANTVLVAMVTSTDGKSTWSQYDGAGRLKRQQDNNGAFTRFYYDAAGNLTDTWGTATNPVHHAYNDLNQRIAMRTFRSGVTASDTDTPPGGLAGTGDLTTWNYQTTTGLLTSKVDATQVSTGTTSYQYDAMSRVSQRTDARGRVTNYSYTAAGLPDVTSYADGVTTNVDFDYDRAGRVSSVSDATGGRSFSYYDSGGGGYETDLLNKSARLQTESFTSGFYGSGRTLTYTYQYENAGHANGPLSAVKIDSGSAYQAGYGYDGYGRLSSATYNGGTPFTYSYVANSNLVDTVAQSSGYLRDYDYETASNRLATLKHSWSTVSASALESRLTYDNLGQRNTEKIAGTGYMTTLGRASDPGVHLDYIYTARSEIDSSARYQLTSGWGVGAIVSGTDRDYTYDTMGNRTADIIGGVTGSYTPNNLNQYGSAPGAATLTYDGNGNLLNDGTRAYTYDGENRLLTVTQGSSSWSYVYDYLGRRVKKLGAGLTELRYLYDGWNLIAELNSSGTILRKSVWGLDVSGSLQGAGGVGGLLQLDDNGTSYWPVYDASRNVIGLYTSAGAYAAAYEYDVFGRQQTAAGSYAANNPYRAATKYTDTETTLVYYGHRYYHPALGRFINRDPIEEAGGINLYTFCGNDGVNRYDLLGAVDIILDPILVLPQPTTTLPPFTVYGIQTEAESVRQRDADEQRNRGSDDIRYIQEGSRQVTLQEISASLGYAPAAQKPKEYKDLSGPDRIRLLTKLLRLADVTGDRATKKKLVLALQVEVGRTKEGIIGNLVAFSYPGLAPFIERTVAGFVARTLNTSLAALDGVSINALGAERWSLAAENSTILANNATGKAAELLARAELEAQGYTILGSNVTAQTSQGIRFIDHLVDVSGDLFAVEVKSGDAFRSSGQLLKDTAMEFEGATLSGPNVPTSLQGQVFKIPTVEMHYP